MRLVAMVAALTLAVSAPVTGAPSLASSGCPLFPADNVWHADVSRLGVPPRSGAYLAAMGTGAGIHADFGSGAWEGGPDAGGDRHLLVVQAGTCRLYELFDAHREGGGWRAGSGAVWDLRSNRPRPAGWTSADAAGLPVLLRRVTLADFEAVDTAPLRISPASAAARPVTAARPARPTPRKPPAALPSGPRRWFQPEPRAATAADARTGADAGSSTGPAVPAPAAGADAGSGDAALLPPVLTVILGLTTAALAGRAIRRPRRDDVPPDPDRSSSRRR
jgi:hypothetical protein